MPTNTKYSSLLLGAGLGLLLIGTPRAALAADFHARALLGPGLLHNDDVSGLDSSGYGLLSQLDLGATWTPWLALHGTLIADHSGWMSFDRQITGGDYTTTVLGLGLGATGTWRQWSLGVTGGAQLTWHPDAINPNDGASGAGLGPFVSANAGYLFPALDALQLGAQAMARYRVGKDDLDPSGYQLGVGLSLALAQ